MVALFYAELAPKLPPRLFRNVVDTQIRAARTAYDKKFGPKIEFASLIAYSSTCVELLSPVELSLGHLKRGSLKKRPLRSRP